MANRDMKSQLSQEPKSSSTKFVISSRQSMMMTAGTIIGAGILTLPRSATADAHQSAWLTTLIAGALAFLLMWVITKLGFWFHGKTMVEYGQELFTFGRTQVIGKIITILISVVFIAVWLALAIKSIRIFAELLEVAVLPETPIEVIVATILIAMMFFLLMELEVIARFNEILFPLMVVPGALIAIISLFGASWTNIFPFYVMDWHAFLKNLGENMFAFQGFSIMVLFMAFTQKGKNTLGAFGGIAIPSSIYALVIFAAIAVFGYEEIQNLTWPTLELMKSSGSSLLIFQRLEALFVAVWVAAVFLTVGNLFYAGCFALAQIFPTKKEDAARKWIALCFLPILYWLVMLPGNIYQLFNWSIYIGYAGLLVFCLILLLYVVALARGKGRRRSHEAK